MDYRRQPRKTSPSRCAGQSSRGACAAFAEGAARPDNANEHRLQRRAKGGVGGRVRKGETDVADHTVLDVRGLQCPLPVLRAKKAMRSLEVGETLAVLATDTAAPKDFASFCDSAGHVLVDSREENGVFTITMRKRS
ncbi:MAG: sulfurtransferase TusA family protein [Rhodospirillales bacterium]|nr:sulfurtransferase TusA family protein [Rhodospirillales bacterium]